MTGPTVLLTGAGGAALPSKIDGLRRKGYRVVAVDADANAAGLYLADRGYRVPFAADPAFADTFRAICLAEGVAALVPLVDEELLSLARPAEEEGSPARPPRGVTPLCLDKYALMRRLADAGLQVPETACSARAGAMPFVPAAHRPRQPRRPRSPARMN